MRREAFAQLVPLKYKLVSAFGYSGMKGISLKYDKTYALKLTYLHEFRFMLITVNEILQHR